MIENLNIPKVFIPDVILKDFNYSDFIKKYYILFKEKSLSMIKNNLIIDKSDNSYKAKNQIFFENEFKYYIYNNGCNDLVFPLIYAFNKNLFMKELTNYVYNSLSSTDKIFLNNLLNEEVKNFLLNEPKETYQKGHSLYKKIGMFKIHLLNLKIIKKDLLFKKIKYIKNILDWELNLDNYINKYQKVSLNNKIYWFIDSYFSKHEQNNKFLKIMVKDISKDIYREVLLDSDFYNSNLANEIKKTSIKIQVSNSHLIDKIKNLNDDDKLKVLKLLNKNSLWSKIIYLTFENFNDLLKYEKPELLVKNIIFPNFLNFIMYYKDKNLINTNKKNKIFKMLIDFEDKKLLKLISFNQKIRSVNQIYGILYLLIDKPNNEKLNIFKNINTFSNYLRLSEIFDNHKTKNNIKNSLINYILKNKNINMLIFNLLKEKSIHHQIFYNRDFLNMMNSLDKINNNQRAIAFINYFKNQISMKSNKS